MYKWNANYSIQWTILGTFIQTNLVTYLRNFDCRQMETNSKSLNVFGIKIFDNWWRRHSQMWMRPLRFYRLSKTRLVIWSRASHRINIEASRSCSHGSGGDYTSWNKHGEYSCTAVLKYITGWVRLIRIRLIRSCQLIRSFNFLVIYIYCLF